MGIQLEHVSLVHANGVQAVNDVSCVIKAGERVAIIGPSGAGKTTLLRLCSTALKPSSGTIKVLGADPWRLGRSALRRLRSRIGMVHQAPPLPARQRAVTAVLAGRLGQWSLWKSLASLAYPMDIPGARNVLARMEMDDKVFERCGVLSGGQLQRVGVARVLYQEPDLIMTDEPVSAMDPALSDRIIGELTREATTRGVTLVASLHAVDLALHWFPRIIGIRSGEIAFDLPPVRVSDNLLSDLYASESIVVPTQNNQPVALPAAGIRRKPLCS
ncbi:MAG TPA: ATP-binding cassette domain-containing protein [Burkholderiales bacterium]|nr:ATP-binding cassette domain-containing protein [Burkholderiales bacterium]